MEDFLKNSDNIRYFFIVMFYPQIFLNPANNLNLLKFLNLLNHLGPLKNKFSAWCDDIPPEYMKMQVQRLLEILEVEMTKLQPGVVSENLVYIVELNIENIL